MLTACFENGSFFQTLITLLDQPISFSVLKQIHGILITSGLSKHHSFASKLFSIFVNSGHLGYTHRLLRHNPSPSVVHWNKLINLFTAGSSPNKSIKLFVEMQQFGIIPDHFTFSFVVKASARLSSVENGMSLHSVVLKSGHESDIFIQNSLIHMYSTCGEILYARKVFDEMPQRTTVTWNSMLDGYAKCGDLTRAQDVFDSMLDKDIVSWSSLIDGYVKGGEYVEALEVFERMKVVGKPKANEVTMVSVLCACSHLGALELGKRMHCYIVENKLPLTLVLQTSLVDMYAKCGAIEEALAVFRGIPKNKTDVLLWNAVIGGLASHGYVQESLDLFRKMSMIGVVPDDITYLCLLSACAHRGLVKEAWGFFEALKRSGIKPKSKHYACMIDVLARAGQVGEAYDFLNRMPLEPTPSMLGALVSGCVSHGRLDLAELLGKRLVEVDPHHDGRYVGLSNVYAAVKRWDDAKIMRRAMDITGVKKIPGLSYVEISGGLERFIAHDKRHPKSEEIYVMEYPAQIGIMYRVIVGKINLDVNRLQGLRRFFCNATIPEVSASNSCLRSNEITLENQRVNGIQEYDIAIVGGGMVGMALACSLASSALTRKLSVAIIDDNPALTSGGWIKREEPPDPRVSTITPATISFLENIGAWKYVKQQRHAYFDKMQVWDYTGLGYTRYNARDVNKETLGCVVENKVLHRSLSMCIQEKDFQHTVLPSRLSSLASQSSVSSTNIDSQLATLVLDNGSNVVAKLVVGADGGRSRVRELAGFSSSGQKYPQNAVICTVEHTMPNHCAWQRFLPAGPIALLPIGDNFSNIVWTMSPKESSDCKAMTEDDFVKAVNRALDYGFGPRPQSNSSFDKIFSSFTSDLVSSNESFEAPPMVIKLASERMVFPLSLVHTNTYAKRRVVLIGDAAHTVHPLAGQGVNLGFGDASVLAKVISEGTAVGIDIGQLSLLQRYEAERKPANYLMATILDGFQKAYSVDLGPLNALRAAAFHGAHYISPLKKNIILYASGEKKIPFLSWS